MYNFYVYVYLHQEDGNTALMRGAMHGHVHVVKLLLLLKGVKVDLRQPSVSFSCGSLLVTVVLSCHAANCHSISGAQGVYVLIAA